MTSFDATSRSAICPYGETVDLVAPGMLSVAGGGRVLGDDVPEFDLIGGLSRAGKLKFSE